MGRGLRPDRAIRDRKILGVPARCGEGSAGGLRFEGNLPWPPSEAEIPQHRSHPTLGSHRFFRKRGALGLMSWWPDCRAAPCTALVLIQAG